MQEFAWAENNFGVTHPDELQREKIDVYYPPNISPNRKVVDLSDGRVDYFWPETNMPREGLFADYESLEDFCRKKGIPLVETEGYVSTQPMGHDEAGDPLHKEGH